MADVRRKWLVRTALVSLVPLVIAALLLVFTPERESRWDADTRLVLQQMQVSSAQELEAVFQAMGYDWPPRQDAPVPPLQLAALPQDLHEVDDVAQKKALFFRSLLPIVLAENERLIDKRAKLMELFETGIDKLDDEQRRWLEATVAEFQVKGNIRDVHVQRKLLRRVDAVPPALVLAQAAKESGWGTSRFARQGNNLFGQWTYDQNQGMVPLNRAEGARHAVRAFGSINDSVQSYMSNLNTNNAYNELRLLREEMRQAGKELDGHRLANGLVAYSSRGEAYVQEIQSLMRSNRLLTQVEKVRLKRDHDG